MPYIRVLDKELQRKLTIVEPEVLDEDVYTLLDEPAVDSNEAPLAPEFSVTRGGKQSAPALDGQPADTKKENS